MTLKDRGDFLINTDPFEGGQHSVVLHLHADLVGVAS